MKGYIIKDNVTSKYYKGKQRGTTAFLCKAGIYKSLKKAIKAIKRNSDPRLNNSYTLYKLINKGDEIEEYLNLVINLELKKD